jgi:hypothetical protein
MPHSDKSLHEKPLNQSLHTIGIGFGAGVSVNFGKSVGALVAEGTTVGVAEASCAVSVVGVVSSGYAAVDGNAVGNKVSSEGWSWTTVGTDKAGVPVQAAINAHDTSPASSEIRRRVFIFLGCPY